MTGKKDGRKGVRKEEGKEGRKREGGREGRKEEGGREGRKREGREEEGGKKGGKEGKERRLFLLLLPQATFLTLNHFLVLVLFSSVQFSRSVMSDSL